MANKITTFLVDNKQKLVRTGLVIGGIAVFAAGAVVNNVLRDRSTDVFVLEADGDFEVTDSDTSDQD